MQSGLDFLSSLPLWDGRTGFDLSAMRQLADSFGNPQNKIPAIHVAGTNGKGTVCALLAAMLRASGKRVGLCTSPHLVHVTERCVVDGRPVEDDVFSRAVDAVRARAGELALNPSYFEYVTMACFLVFAEMRCDAMVVEVGLGGRLDATNIIERPLVTVISSIDFDHTQLLGSSLAEIAREKAGIAKPGVALVVGPVSGDAQHAIAMTAHEQGAVSEFWGREFLADSLRGVVRTASNSFELPRTVWQMFSGYQRDNCLLAVRAAQHLGLSAENIVQGLCQARWPGRLEWFEGEAFPATLFDAAHNPGGMQALVEYLESEIPKRQPARVAIVVSMLSSKDWRSALGLLKDFVARAAQQRIEANVIFTKSDHHLCVSPEELQLEWGGGETGPKPREALNSAWKFAGSRSDSSMTKTGIVVVTGSIYLLGVLRPEVTNVAFCTFADR